MRAKLYFCTTVLLVAACAAQHSDNRNTSDAAVPHDAAPSDDNVPLDGTEQPDPLSGNLEELGDVECQVTLSYPEAELSGSQNELSKTRTVAWTYDAATRRLVVDDLVYDLDEVGHVVREYTRDGGGTLTPKYAHRYDAHGRVEYSESYQPPRPPGETLFLNTYDGDRLIMVETGPNFYPATSRSQWTYRYHDRSAPHMWTRVDVRTPPVEGTIERTIVDRRVSTTRSTVDGMLAGVNTFIYAGDQIETLDLNNAIFGSIDGTPHELYQWVRDAQDRLIELTIDGRTGFEGSNANGVPDSKRTYSEGCAPLLEKLPWLASEPRPGDFRPSSAAVFP